MVDQGAETALEMKDFFDFNRSAPPAPNLHGTKFWYKVGNLLLKISKPSPIKAYYPNLTDFCRYQVEQMIFIQEKEGGMNILHGQE